ncbi:ComEA family DNA-binding protein [Erysipelotrichaceae bacterium HCN-30851]
MKKIFFVFIILIFFYGRYDMIDLSKYDKETKEVEVKGEVKNPGVYQAELHASVENIIVLAGGITENADISTLNMAQDLPDQSVLVVSKIQEDSKVSINTATLEDLITLPGIGPATAQRIIEYRTQQPFNQLEDIMKVKGIKEKLFSKMKDRICL